MKYIVGVNQFGNVVDKTGLDTCIKLPAGDFEEYEQNGVADKTLQLVKQGVTVDEIIKLKNADLL